MDKLYSLNEIFEKRFLPANVADNLKAIQANLKAPTRNTIIHWSDVQVDRTLMADIAAGSSNVVGVCVPSVYLDMAHGMLCDSKVLYGAQNMYHQENKEQ